MVSNSNQYNPTQEIDPRGDKEFHEGFLVPYKICDPRKQRRNESNHQKSTAGNKADHGRIFYLIAGKINGVFFGKKRGVIDGKNCG